MRIFLTGGTGNIGQYVTRALVRRGHELVLLTRTPERIPDIGRLPGVRLVAGSILDREVMAGAVTGCDAVIHIALGWGNDPVSMLENDTKSTLCLLTAAERAGVGRFLYTSSTAACGPMHGHLDETAACRPDNLYGATKAASEQFILGFNRYYGGQGVPDRAVRMRRNIIRPGYTFSNPAYENGASQSDTRFHAIADAVLHGAPLSFDAMDGTQFLSAERLATLYAAVVESELDGEVFFALGGTFTTWADIARRAATLCGSESRITEAVSAPSKAPWRYSTGKMDRLIGPETDEDARLEAHIAWTLARARRKAEGLPVHDILHVW